jgi:hypothetical protein
MATSEIVVNDYLAAALRKRYKSWEVTGIISCENTGTLAGFSSQRPDLIVRDNPMSPVSVETEFFPAATVESDAAARLGKIYSPTGGEIHSAIAVRYSSNYKNLAGKAITQALEHDQNLEYCLLTGETGAEFHRWPAVGFIKGSVTDLAFVIASAKVSPIAVERGATVLESGARALAAMLEVAAASNPKLGPAIARLLKQDATNQTFAMASTIIVNAFVFQDTIAGMSPELEQVRGLSDLGGTPTRKEVISVWETILKINYWPIFGIARGLINSIPASIWMEFVDRCLEAADALLSLNLGRNPDLRNDLPALDLGPPLSRDVLYRSKFRFPYVEADDRPEHTEQHRLA